jgi:hypothetical protein
MRARAISGIIAAALLLGAAQLAAAPKDAGADAAASDAGASDAGASDAAATDAGASDAAADDAGAADAGPPPATCKERVPEGAKRPEVKEQLSDRVAAGYVAELKLVISHGKGETVLPEGFHLQKGSDAANELTKAGFVIPDPDGGAAPTLKTDPGEGGTAVTTLTIPVVPLPKEAGRTILTLPPLPIAIWRASNDYLTICTKPHAIQVDEPIANELDPKVKPNPPGRPQREDWPLMRNLATGIPIGFAIAMLGALGYRWWSRRPKAMPEAPKIPPWVLALEELESIRVSKLLEQGKTGEYFDRVSDAIRRYLGARYGFDQLPEGYNGLETTTGEMLTLLKRVRPPIAELPRIKEFLDDCDLVKFARFDPTEDHCLEALRRGEAIVRKTIPIVRLPSEPRDENLPPAEASS